MPLQPVWSGNSGGRRNAESQLPSTPAAPASPGRAPSACLGAAGRPSERPPTKRKVGAAQRAGLGTWGPGWGRGSSLPGELWRYRYCTVHGTEHQPQSLTAVCKAHFSLRRSLGAVLCGLQITAKLTKHFIICSLRMVPRLLNCVSRSVTWLGLVDCDQLVGLCQAVKKK